jgi:hypothetical protein
MIPVSLRHFRTPNTKLYLNGPYIQIVDQPSSITVGIGSTVVISGFATVSYIENPTAPIDGTVTYRWYDAITDAPLPEGTKYVGTATSQLTVNDAKSPEDNLDRFYFDAGFTPANQISGELNNPTSGNAI